MRKGHRLIYIFVNSPNDIYIYAFVSQIGAIIANVSNIIYFRKKWGIKLSVSFSKDVFTHVKYCLILFGNSISMLIYVNSDITLLGIFCGDREVGLYSVAVKIYTVIKQLLNAMLVVGIPRMSRLTGIECKDKVDGQLNKLLRTLLIFLIPVIVGLFVLSDSIICVMAGVGYAESAYVLKVLSLTLAFSTGVCFYSNLVLIPNNKLCSKRRQ